MKDQVIVEKWREETLQQEEEGGKSLWRKLTPTMVWFYFHRTSTLASLLYIQINYVLEELHGYASLRDPETGIEVQFTHSNIVRRA